MTLEISSLNAGLEWLPLGSARERWPHAHRSGKESEIVSITVVVDEDT